MSALCTAASAVKGFWDALNPQQKKAALEYRGEENNGKSVMSEQGFGK